MKGKLLTVNEISELNESDKKYRLESNFKSYLDGIYSVGNGHFANGDLVDGGTFISIKYPPILDGRTKVYEWIEEIIKPIKTYELEEAIKLLSANPKLKFETTLLLHDSAFIESECTTTLQIQGNFIAGVPYGIPYVSKWTLVEEKAVPFMEAAQAFSEGKNVRCECGKDGTVFNPISSRFMSLTIDSILEGKWYIDNGY